MSAPEEQPVSYQDIFIRQRVPTRFRTPDDYFFHTVTEAESEDHAGEVYAIPRQLYVDHDVYNHHENGALVSVDATVGPDASVENRAIVGPQAGVKGSTTIRRGAIIGHGAQLLGAEIDEEVVIGDRVDIRNSTIGRQSRIEDNAEIEDTRTGPLTEIGSGANLIKVSVGSDVKIGPDSTIDNAEIGPASRLQRVKIWNNGLRSIIGWGVKIEDGVVLYGDNAVGDYAKLHEKVTLASEVVVGDEAELQRDVTIDLAARIGSGSLVMAGAELGAGRKIRPQTIVAPREKFARLRRVSGPKKK